MNKSGSTKWAGERVGVLSLLDQAMHAYIQCVHMSGNQFLTEHVTLMKTQDFVERLTLAGPAALNSESFCRLHQQPWSDSANMFFTYLRHAFGVASNFKKNAMYSGRQGNPALASVAKTQDFYQRIQNSIREGRIGPLHELPIRIWRNLRYILLAKDI
jgi:hypothetical protein